MYISEEDFKELLISEEVKNFVSLIEKYPNRFEFNYGPETFLGVKDIMTGVMGCVQYKVHIYGEIEASGLCDLNHINGAEAKLIYEAITVGIKKKLEAEKESAKEKFHNAYKNAQD